MNPMNEPLDPGLLNLATTGHHDLCSLLGRQPGGYRLFLPHARKARFGHNGETLDRVDDSAFFVWQGDENTLPHHPEIHWWDHQGIPHHHHDPYSFDAQIPDFDLHLFSAGRHLHAQHFLGANPWQVDGIHGTLFATWAPNAERVSVIGDFNHWDGRVHVMHHHQDNGVWEIFIPAIGAGTLYKFEIRCRGGGIETKSDPYGKAFQLRPDNAALVCGESEYVWRDDDWMHQRAHFDWLHQPMSIYEVHLGSWRRHDDGGFCNYRDLAEQLVAHVKFLGHTHIELLPVTEHPLDASWGYQTLGYFAPTSRFGTPDDFRYFIDHCHQHGIGVILDWVPAHFPTDAHGLARFDGTALYEHEDPRRGEHRDWGTLIYNYGRNEVKNFLIASALYWLQEFHLDGLRVDAVASMLYLDYSREEGDWLPNQYGGRENLEAIDFLREMNQITHEHAPGSVTLAEESTAWPAVSRPVYTGGLGFSMKWNMGWMHDTLEYMKKDPIHRHYHHDELTFGMLYAFSENFVLPFSHDEVVHGKGSLRYKMPGDEWQQFANLRLLYTYMFSYPGKKLLFMGSEFGQGPEWNHDTQLDWYVLQYPLHRGLQDLVRELNGLYRQLPALHRFEFDQEGFSWIDCHDADQSVLSYQRRAGEDVVVVVLNFTPVVRKNYRLGVPRGGGYREALNSDSAFFGGGNVGNGGYLESEAIPWMGLPHSIELTLPPLAGLILQPV